MNIVNIDNLMYDVFFFLTRVQALLQSGMKYIFFFNFIKFTYPITLNEYLHNFK